MKEVSVLWTTVSFSADSKEMENRHSQLRLALALFWFIVFGRCYEFLHNFVVIERFFVSHYHSSFDRWGCRRRVESKHWDRTVIMGSYSSALILYLLRIGQRLICWAQFALEFSMDFSCYVGWWNNTPPTSSHPSISYLNLKLFRLPLGCFGIWLSPSNPLKPSL